MEIKWNNHKPMMKGLWLFRVGFVPAGMKRRKGHACCDDAIGWTEPERTFSMSVARPQNQPHTIGDARTWLNRSPKGSLCAWQRLAGSLNSNESLTSPRSSKN